MNERRKPNYRPYYALAVSVASVIILLLCLTVLFRVKSVEIRGVTLYTGEQITNIGGTEYGMNLVRTDTDRVVKRLKESLVYLDEVEVVKSYPSTLIIKCTEAEKAADIEFEDGYYVLSYSGRILEADNRKPTGGIPIVRGFALDKEKIKPGGALAATDDYSAKVLMSLLKQLDKHGFEEISEIDIRSRADITVEYQGRLTIKLGSSADLDFKLSSVSAVIEKLGDEYVGELRYNGSSVGISAIAKDMPATTAPVIEPAETGEDSAQSGETVPDSSEQDTWWVPETTTTTADQVWWTPEETTEQVWWTPEDNGGGWDQGDNDW